MKFSNMIFPTHDTRQSAFTSHHITKHDSTTKLRVCLVQLILVVAVDESQKDNQMNQFGRPASTESSVPWYRNRTTPPTLLSPAVGAKLAKIYPPCHRLVGTGSIFLFSRPSPWLLPAGPAAPLAAGGCPLRRHLPGARVPDGGRLSPWPAAPSLRAQGQA